MKKYGHNAIQKYNMKANAGIIVQSVNHLAIKIVNFEKRFIFNDFYKNIIYF